MKKLLLILIIVLAIITRFWRLGDYPALNADEAAIGYNAYSLIQTGKDEHGNAWPIHFQSFNDYKPGLYFYMVLPFVKTLGLNEWAVRIPGAFLGVLTVLTIYLLTKELLKNERLSLIASAMLAISPWHIHFSRGGWEVNTATFFITLGIWLFLRFVNSTKSKYLCFSVLAFTASLYSYHAARIIVPLLCLGLIAIYRKTLFIRINLRLLVISFSLLVATILPLAKELIGPAGISRAAGVGLFADFGPLNRVNEQRGEHANFTSIIPKLLHNKVTNYGLAFLANWASHYHGEFLFLSGDAIQRNKVPETGQMYMIDALFIIFGLVILIKSWNKSLAFVAFWLIVAPVASALTFQSPHALRTHNMVIPLTIISAFGLSYLVTWLKNRGLVIGYWLLVILIGWSFMRYEHMYWIHMAKEYPYSSQYGIKELVSYLNSGIEDRYKKVMVTDRYDQPYILFLFYLKYDPAKFQKEHTLTPRDQYGFSTVRSFGKYTFTSVVNWDRTREEFRDSLVAGTDEEILPGTNIVKEIYGTNGYKYFEVVAN